MIQGLIEKIERQLNPILDKSGHIVFSSIATITKGDLYTLGLNPGGGSVKTISEKLIELPFKHHNSYIDETWENKKAKYRKGRHPLQRNFTELIKAIDYEPEKVFSSNLIFTRSHGQSGSNYPINADICWTVHQEFIKIVDPDCFIVFGNSKISPYQFIKDKYHLETIDKISCGQGNWKCFFALGPIEGRKRKLIGVPHLSRYYITRHEDVIKWITSKIR